MTETGTTTATQSETPGATRPSRGDLGDAWTLTEAELRTQYRHLRSSMRKTLATISMVVLFSVVFPLTVMPSAVGFGEGLASGSVPLGAAGAAWLGVAGVAGYVGAAGGFNQPRVGAIGPLIRTSIPPTAVALGRFCNRTLQALALVVPALVVLLAGVGYGAGSVLAPLLVAVAFAPVFLAGLVVGRIVGSIARYLNERVQVSLWVKALVATVVLGVVFVGTQLLMGTQYESESGFGAVVSGPILPGAPLQGYAGVVLAPLGATPQPLGVAMVGLTIVAMPLALLATIRLETTILVRDLGSDSAATSQVESSRDVMAPFDRFPAGRVAWRYLLRTRRDPRTLAHLSPLLFGAFGMGASLIQDPAIVFSLGPIAAVVGGVVLAGAAYCLNPLGDERDQLALLYTSTPSVGVLLRGRMLAGIVLGLLVAIGIGSPLSLVANSPAFTVGLALLGVFLALVSACIAVGLGAIVPQFEQREYMSVERAHPSTPAMLGFFFGGLIVTGIGILLLWMTISGAEPVLAVLGWIAYVSVLSIAAAGSYRYAVSRMDAFTLDDI